MNKKDREIMDKKLKSPIDFYSYNRSVMENLAIKTKYTANSLVGNKGPRNPNYNLNKDIGFTNDRFVVGKGLASDAIDWTDPKNEFDIKLDDSENKKSYIKILFPSYHVRRARMIKGKFEKRDFIPREKMLNVEKVHFLYGEAIRFSN
ncbi:hypothetical protein R7V75_03805 [Mesomycoplasma ovipneumoniae]|uniref:Uncharacterized protein n=1 Tax=Mesomycoplasma ovipneumoniae TaxID=29562 RepID=A0AAJ2UA14_9BACT|nr:hypothetical protein [Mesomycoplasma ovipneumoniae]MDW2834804.1 hypothetical protein [Mesomycoplasma ovipneumoniae]MDW2891948.1 hypothetical protein [Mesomycoplasma ovipneumoniae]MDW2892671.1 hypothetical protein [Mesomycoplasma ovipneumoniae]MDW2908829.1 hypothetical protein [Mesomycoplasma ovipneumoniae]